MAGTNLKHRRSEARGAGIAVAAVGAVRVAPNAKEASTTGVRGRGQEVKAHRNRLGVFDVDVVAVDKLGRGPFRKNSGLNFEDMAGLIRTIDVGCDGP